jgi:hydrogenase maturation protease
LSGIERSAMPPARGGVLIIGLGNEYRRDDAAGLVAARRLKEATAKRVRVLEESGEGTALMESWKGADTVIVIDALHSGAKAGTVRRLDPHRQPIPTGLFHCSTHAFGVAEAVELARALGQLPPRLIVYGIEGTDFEAGLGLSPQVDKAVPRAVERILAEVHALSASRPSLPRP